MKSNIIDEQDILASNDNQNNYIQPKFSQTFQNKIDNKRKLNNIYLQKNKIVDFTSSTQYN